MKMVQPARRLHERLHLVKESADEHAHLAQQIAAQLASVGCTAKIKSGHYQSHRHSDLKLDWDCVPLVPSSCISGIFSGSSKP